MNPKFKTIHYSLLTIYVFFFLAGCGYTTTLAPFPHIRSITVSPIKNATLKPGINQALQQALSEKFASGLRFRDGKGEGIDAILDGTITGYSSEGMAFDKADIARRFRLRITLRLSLFEKGGKALIKDEELHGEAFYTGSGDLVSLKAAEDDAMNRALANLSDAIYYRIMEGF